MADQFPSKQNFYDAEKDLRTVSAVSNSRDPDTGAEILTWETRRGDITDTLKGRLDKLGAPVVGDTTAGCTLVGPNDVVLNNTVGSSGFGNYYTWSGSFLPAGHVVSPGTDPAIIGSGYLPRSDIVLRAQIVSSSGATFVGSENGTVQDDIDTLYAEQEFTEFFSTPERFGGQQGNTATDQSPAIQSAINSGTKCTMLRGQYDVSTQIDVANKSTLLGQGNDTGLVWRGGNGATGQSVLRVASGNPAVNALNGVTVKDFVVDMQGAQNLTGVDMLYASVQSAIDGVQVTQVGANSIGFRVGKEWYARLQRCSVRNDSRVGTAVYVDTSVGQVNSVPLDVQINGADIGFGLDTSGDYIYNLDMPATAHAENCNVGLRVWPGQGIRSGVIRGYFENNGIDVWWGSAGASPADRTQTILWLGSSFNPNGSLVRLYEGNHIFDGCDRINTLEVHAQATVEIRGSIVNNIINTTGDPNAVRYRPSAKTILSTSNHGNTSLLPGRQINDIQTTSATSAAFDIISRLFGVTNPTTGRSARCVATSRRAYENTVKFLEFVITQSSSGTWGYTLTGGVADGSWLVAINSSTGVITITDTRGDSKVYTLTASPM